VEFKVVVKLVQTCVVPVIAVGFGFTVTVAVFIQPVALRLYVITEVAGPAPTAVTVPEEEPMVATPVAELDQVPPGVASLSVDINPEQTASVPPIAAGFGFTVTGVVLKHPVAGIV
jgi:hypothetical protein